MPVICRGMSALAVAGMLGCLAPQPAQAQTAVAIEEVIDAILAVLSSSAVRQLFLPTPQGLDSKNNTAFGFQSQPCSEANGFKSTVEGGETLPCMPNAFTQFGAGLYVRSGMSPDDCQYLNSVGAAAIRNAVIPHTTMSIEYLQTQQPLSGVGFPGVGAVCSPTSGAKESAVGYLGGQWIFLFQMVSKDECAMMFNMSTSKFSCDGYYRAN